MMLSSSAVDRVWGDRLGTTAKLIAVGLLESGRPDAAQGLTTAKTVAKVSVVSDTAEEQERGTPIHKS
jgi:hypothetical protein